MNSDKNNDILTAWQKNGSLWIKTIEEKLIRSRPVTNKAILGAILNKHPKTVLDIGCGEGWMCRALEAQSIKCTGIDGVVSLIDHATAQTKNGVYYQFTYDQIIEGENWITERFDLISYNYSLFSQNCNQLLSALKKNLKTDGCMVIQTLYPSSSSERSFESQWQEENWNGFPEEYTSYSWFNRSLEDWKILFRNVGLHLENPMTIPFEGKPFSIIFTLVNPG